MCTAWFMRIRWICAELLNHRLAGTTMKTFGLQKSLTLDKAIGMQYWSEWRHGMHMYVQADAFKMHSIWPKENCTSMLNLQDIRKPYFPNHRLQLCYAGTINVQILTHFNFRALIYFHQTKFTRPKSASILRCADTSVSVYAFLIGSIFFSMKSDNEWWYRSSCCFPMMQ